MTPVFPSPIALPSLPTFEHLDSSHSYVWASVLLVVVITIYSYINDRKFDSIPAVTATHIFSRFSQGIHFTQEGAEWTKTGYKRYKDRIFRLPLLSNWYVIVTGEKLMDEYRKVPDDIFSLGASFEEQFQGKYFLGPTINTNRYHVPIVRNQLTRNLGHLFDDIREEGALAIEENIPITDEWTNIKVYPALLQVIARMSNRTFVGVPLCRNPEYIGVNIRHTLDVGEGTRILPYFPEFLKPLAARYLTNAPRSIATVLKHLRPIIEERQKKLDEYGSDYPDKPLDFLSWLLDEAEGEERTPEKLTSRIVHMNFAAVHTTSISFTHALYHLAAHPQFIAPLREEIESIVNQEGWSKGSFGKMRKLDSFFKESQRYYGISSISIVRKALKEYTFSDGTLVPKGAMLFAASFPRHHDDEVYANADTFQPFRFSELREKDGLNSTNQFVNTNLDYLAFGHGSHACPGRFFVANEMKIMMAQLLLNYDIKLEKQGVPPRPLWHGFSCVPDSSINVMFRRRQGS
ncbi:hypothetical protein M422DRAFT_27187 [Sphaerobolus stellatus SS14]|nr:hypothetical protein M422DRAFT_27187 [Sphaerobolus stellatus SS14]